MNPDHISPDKLSKLQATYELKAKLGTSGVERPESGRVRSGLLGCFQNMILIYSDFNSVNSALPSCSMILDT